MVIFQRTPRYVAMFTRKSRRLPYSALITIALLLLTQGCLLPIIYIVSSYTKDGYATVTVEVPRSAKEVFDVAEKLARTGKARSGEPFIVEEIDSTDLSIKARATDDTWWLELNIVPITDDKSQMIMIGQSPGDIEEQEQRGLNAIKRICDELGVRYTVIRDTPMAE